LLLAYNVQLLTKSLMCCDRNNDNFAFVILQLTLKNQGSCKIRKAKKAVLKSTGTVTFSATQRNGRPSGLCIRAVLVQSKRSEAFLTNYDIMQ
jgi:hypothetical protein